MLFSLLLTISALCAVSCTPQSLQAPSRCTRRYVRREIRDLSPPERNTLFDTIKKLNSGARPTAWDRFAHIHLLGQNIFHGCAMFLPWHRMMLKRMEQELQKVNPNVVLAYWDWSIDSNQPERSAILSPAFLGGDSQGACLKDGPFAGMQVHYPTPHCLARRFRATGVGPFVSGVIIDAVIDQSEEYEDFRINIENTPHATPHIGIGGDLSTMQSPNDPIFYLHHGYIDKLWYDWQQLDESRLGEYYGVNRNGQKASLNDQLPHLNAQVKDALSARSLCYSYAPPRSANRLRRRSEDAEEGAQEEEDSSKAPKAAMDTKVRLPTFSLKDAQCAAGQIKEEIKNVEPLPKCWIKMNGSCEKTVRRMEKAYKTIVDKVNEEYIKLHPKKEEPDSAY